MAKTAEEQWLTRIDSLGCAAGMADRRGDTASRDQIRDQRNQLQDHRPGAQRRH